MHDISNSVYTKYNNSLERMVIMLEKTRRVLMCSLLSVTMSSNFCLSIYAEETNTEEEIVENEVIEETTEDVIEEEIIEEEVVEETVTNESSDANPTYNGYTYQVTSSGAIQLIDYKGSASKLEIPSTIDGKPVKYIGLQVFAGNTSIQEVIFPDTMEQIADNAFKGCTNLHSITWGNNIWKIGSEAFWGCDLTEVVIPATVTSIGTSAFENNLNLEKVYYNPTYIDSIDGDLGCFKNCGQNIFGFELIIGENVQKIPDNLFRSAYGEDYKTFPKLVKITGGESLTEIGSYAFANCRVLTQAELPANVHNINSYAFFDCRSLNNITFSENIQYIGENVFKYCTSLVTLTFTGNAPIIEENAFADLYSISCYYPDANSITWEPVIKSNYGATYCEWIGQVNTSITTDTSSYRQIYKTQSWGLGNYSSNCTFEKTKQHYSFEGATSIGIKFEKGCETESGNDYAMIVGRDKTLKYSGEAFPTTPIILAGNSVDVGFVSDNTIQKAGFSAEIYPIYQVEKGIGEVTVTSPNWPENYPNECDMIQEFRFDGASRINVIFDPTSSTESYGGSNVVDYIEFFKEDGTSMGRYGGKNFGSGLFVNGSYIKIKFHSDGKDTDKGFSLQVKPVYDAPKQSDTVAGYSLSLSGDIGVNFYMDLTDTALKSPDTYMEFSIPGKSKSKVKLTDAKQYKIGENTYYAFPYFVSAKDMTQTVTARLYYRGILQNIFTYTVEDYAQYIISHPDVFETKVVDIAKAMLVYGKAAQQYFNYNTSNLPSIKQNLYPQDLSRFKGTVNATGSVKFVGSRLVLSQKPGLKLYFSGATSSTKFYVNGKEVPATLEGKSYCITISDINKMSTMYEITSTNLSMKYGIFSYGYRAQAFSSDAKYTNLNQLISAMYLYDASFWKTE